MLDCAVMVKRDGFKDIKIVKAFIFFIIILKPSGSILIILEKGLVKRGRTVLFKRRSRDMIGSNSCSG